MALLASGKLRGFTLIELSIVLVIIGLIIGGILVGRDLIDAAAVRAQISQIEKYNTAVNTFRTKYGYLPGDILSATAAQCGFASRTGAQGDGDGNDVIESKSWGGVASGLGQGNGEKAFFWNDLTYANGMNISLIPGSFTQTANHGCDIRPTNISNPVCPTIGSYLPPAMIGGSGAYISVTSTNEMNYFTLSLPLQFSSGGYVYAKAAITVSQAYSIDTKIDDGLPQSGTVLALYDAGDSNYSVAVWADNNPGPYGFGAAPGTSAAPSSNSCFDNGSNASLPMSYSMGQNNGNGVNCALSFKFQ